MSRRQEAASQILATRRAAAATAKGLALELLFGRFRFAEVRPRSRHVYARLRGSGKPQNKSIRLINPIYRSTRERFTRNQPVGLIGFSRIWKLQNSADF